MGAQPDYALAPTTGSILAVLVHGLLMAITEIPDGAVLAGSGHRCGEGIRGGCDLLALIAPGR